MSTSTTRQAMRYQRQEHRRYKLTKADWETMPDACKAFVTFGGKWKNHVEEEKRRRARLSSMEDEDARAQRKERITAANAFRAFFNRVAKRRRNKGV